MPQNKTLTLMRRLIGEYLAGYWRALLMALFFMMLAAAMTAAVAQMMQPILDDVLSGENSDMILSVAVATLLIFVTRGISTYLHTIIMTKIGHGIVADVQKDLFKAFMRLDLAFFHHIPSGQLISRVVNDVQVMRVAVADSLTGVGKNALTLLFLIGVMFYQDWVLSLAAFVIFPFAAFIVAYIGRKLRIVSRNLQEETGSLTGQLSQVFQGIRQVKAYGMEAEEEQRSGQAIDRVKKLNIKSVRVSNMTTPINEIMVGIVVFGIILYGGWQAAQGEMTAGQLGAFLTAFMLAYEPMKKLAKLNGAVQAGLGAAERVFEMIDRQSDIVDKPGAPDLKISAPRIAFDEVEFSYAGSGEKALDRITFTTRPGKVTALVGPSGGGKTTIMNLLPRFYDVSGGSIRIDGHDIRDVSINSLRRNIALVSQDVTIFDDTVAANIAYSRPEADLTEIKEAARKAAAHDFVEGFPEGYQTRVGENGVKLSGGQRQRLSIARAILRDSPILLLDEATSALDNESEKLVQTALRELEKGRTTLVIAHRLSTVQEADQILVLDAGRIVEQGRHAELLKAQGLYARMYQAGLKAEQR